MKKSLALILSLIIALAFVSCNGNTAQPAALSDTEVASRTMPLFTGALVDGKASLGGEGLEVTVNSDYTSAETGDVLKAGGVASISFGLDGTTIAITDTTVVLDGGEYVLDGSATVSDNTVTKNELTINGETVDDATVLELFSTLPFGSSLGM